jgi:hypothetical protein
MKFKNLLVSIPFLSMSSELGLFLSMRTSRALFFL